MPNTRSSQDQAPTSDQSVAQDANAHEPQYDVFEPASENMSSDHKRFWQELELRKLEERRAAQELEFKRLELEAKKIDAEVQLEAKKIDAEVEMKRLEVQIHTQPAIVKQQAIEVPKFKESDDIDTYFRTFELVVESNGWDKNLWSKYLIPKLSGKAREAYAGLTIAQSLDYETLKRSILTKYDVSCEAYRLKFREARRRTDQSVTEWVNVLESQLNGWIKFADICDGDFVSLKDLILREQVLGKMPEDMSVHLRDRNLPSCVELAREADSFVMHRGGRDYWKRITNTRNDVYRAPVRQNRFGVQQPAGSSYQNVSDDVYCAPVRQNRFGMQQSAESSYHQNVSDKCFRCQQPGHFIKDCTQSVATGTSSSRDTNGITCHGCGQPGHIRPNCPSRVVEQKGQGQSGAEYDQNGPKPGKVYKCQVSDTVKIRPQNSVESRLEKCVILGKVQGHLVKMLRDSGCTQTAVKSELVPESCYVDGKTVSLRGIGGTVEVPLAIVDMDCSVVSGKVQVAVIQGLQQDVLLGHDLDEHCGDVMRREVCVLTRAQAEAEVEQSLEAEVELDQYVKQRKADEVDEYSISEPAVPLNVDTPRDSDSVLSVSRNTLIEMQSADDSLQGVRDKIVDVGQIGQHRVCFYDDDGMLMRKWEKQQMTGRVNMTKLNQTTQVVVPKKYRLSIMTMAHDKSGHLGIEKSKDRILAHFYWPGVFKDVMQHCRSCDVCQKLNKGKQSLKVPLLPMPVIDVPFKRIGIDIVGPLDRSKRGKLYLLTIIDYATRYPEAIPLANIRAETVVDALITVFARVGLPQEIVHDQGTNFMSKVTKLVCTKLKIAQLAATPYHQQTNGANERFNGVLKNMLRTLSVEQRRCWDDYIPYFLFAYREVPCQTTGYSPFELLYGRQVRGPLSIMKQNWVARESEPVDVVTHLLDMRRRMQDLMRDVDTNVRKNQDKMKKHYDKTAIERSLTPGDKVLVFLPVGAGKLDSKWQGPYIVNRRVNEVNYEIIMDDKRKKKRILHINLCKRWYDRADIDGVGQCMYVTGVVNEIVATSNGDEQFSDAQFSTNDICPAYEQTQTWEDVNISDTLSKTQVDDVQALLQKHSDMFSDVPGKTHLVQHTIETVNDKPIRQRAYRTPHAYKDKVKAEIDSMLRLGIIEPTVSPYASPIVVVAKPNGDIRVTTDFRMLNKQTEFDPYSMPRIDQILDDVASARYMSTFDLTKGFYQVPLSPESKGKTSFVCPFGQFVYNVLPFGLQNSSSTFQRLMDGVLSGCESFAKAYIDDIVVHSCTWEEHVAHVDAVLTKIQGAGLTVKPVKCKLAMRKVSFLGHEVGSGTINPMCDKIEAVRDFPRPLSKKNVRAFLGLTGYYRKFIANFAAMAKPLTDLTKKNLPNTVSWNEECEIAFVELKKCLISKPVLSAPAFDREFMLQTDASNYGIGAVLSQIDSEGQEHPIVFLSKKLLSNEENYSVPEKETLAIVWGMQKLRYYLLGCKFIVLTDHRALKWLDQMRNANNRLMRWSLALQEFNFVVHYKKGSSNGNADGLSRA